MKNCVCLPETKEQLFTAPSIDELGASLIIEKSPEVTSGCTVQRASLLSVAVSPDVSSEGVPTGVSEEDAVEGEANWPITAWRRDAICDRVFPIRGSRSSPEIWAAVAVSAVTWERKVSIDAGTFKSDFN
ncbi:hypothetical protein ACJJTC_013567 [Scirpophaga incertulas]